MKCEECLPLLEEFADGEVDRQTADSMGAHLAACAECAEAFEALQAEQEMYLRYDRELEVSPAIWEAVRERIAEAPPAREQKRPPLLMRLREQFAVLAAALSVRPALASSMALLLVGVAAGVLWLAQSPRPETQNTIARVIPAESIAGVTPAESPLMPSRGGLPNTTPTPDRESSPDEGGAKVAPSAPKQFESQVASAAPRVNFSKAGAVAPRRAENAGGTGELVVISDTHLGRGGDEDPLLAAQPRALDEDVLAINARLLDPEEKGVARHVEQAQVLLRSFRNARYSEGDGATSIAYEKSLSRKLLDENITLQLEAESAGNKTTKQVLSSLEPFLLDISNLRDEPSRDEVRSIKERMQKKEIIASLQVY
jgi:hypothetical protein